MYNAIYSGRRRFNGLRGEGARSLGLAESRGYLIHDRIARESRVRPVGVDETAEGSDGDGGMKESSKQ